MIWGCISLCWSPGVALSLPLCSSLFICSWMWDHQVHQPLFCRESSPPSCTSLPLLLVWMNVSSLTPWFVGLPYSSFFCPFWLFFVFKLLLSFFWMCEEAQCVYLHLNLVQKFQKSLDSPAHMVTDNRLGLHYLFAQESEICAANRTNYYSKQHG